MKESAMLFFIPFFYYTFASDSTTQCSGIEEYKAGECHCLRFYISHLVQKRLMSVSLNMLSITSKPSCDKLSLQKYLFKKETTAA